MRTLAVILIGAGLIAGCSAKTPAGVDQYALAEAIGGSIGDPSACVVLADAKGKVPWRYQALNVCEIKRAACDAPGERTAMDLAAIVAKSGQPVQASCNAVSWTAGPTPRDGVFYAAVM